MAVRLEARVHRYIGLSDDRKPEAVKRETIRVAMDD